MPVFYNFPKISISGEEYWCIESVKNLKINGGITVSLGDDLDYEVAIFYLDNQVYCLSNVCPHRHQNKIAQGYIKDGNVMCPLHHWTYNLKTGENINKLQGLKSIQAFEVKIIDDYVYIKKPEINLPKWRQMES